MTADSKRVVSEFNCNFKYLIRSGTTPSYSFKTVRMATLFPQFRANLFAEYFYFMPGHWLRRQWLPTTKGYFYVSENESFVCVCNVDRFGFGWRMCEHRNPARRKLG